MSKEKIMWLRLRVSHLLNELDPRPKTRHFIHIPKNGGRAVRLALALKRVALELPLHSRYVDLEPTAERRYFCVVRNAWSRTASRYLHTIRNARECLADSRPFRNEPYDYRSMYSPRTIQMVADAFTKDIEHFGFDFDGAAVRNTYTLG